MKRLKFGLRNSPARDGSMLHQEPASECFGVQKFTISRVLISAGRAFDKPKAAEAKRIDQERGVRLN
jgi:hypothetical protein